MPWGGADGLAWPGGGAVGLACGGLLGGVGDGVALDGVELLEDVLEQSPWRKVVIFAPAIACVSKCCWRFSMTEALNW